MSSLAFLNGEYLDLSEAKVSVFDRGFLFGDSIYDIIPVFDNHAVGQNEHLARLNNSLAGVEITNPYSDDEWREIINHLTQASELADYIIYIQVTRGAAPVRTHHAPEQCSPTVLIALMPMPKHPDHNKGLAVITVEDGRWASCHVKSTLLLPNVLAKTHAKQQHYDDAIFVKNGFALEGTSNNLFIVKAGCVYTPPLTENILPGITRKITLELLSNANMAFKEQAITTEALATADEIWLASSTMDIAPITQLNGKQVGDGKAGPVWQKTYDLFQQYKKQKTL